MNKIKIYSKILDAAKWFCFIPAMIIYNALRSGFSDMVAFPLATAFGIAFYVICSRGRMHIISEDIVKDVKETLKKFGHENSVFEVKGFSFGLVIRVYLFKANVQTPMYTRLITDKLSKGWYKNLVWVTQVVNVAEESQIKKLQKELDRALIETLEEEKDKKRY